MRTATTEPGEALRKSRKEYDGLKGAATHGCEALDQIMRQVELPANLKEMAAKASGRLHAWGAHP